MECVNVGRSDMIIKAAIGMSAAEPQKMRLLEYVFWPLRYPARPRILRRGGLAVLHYIQSAILSLGVCHLRS